MAYKRREGYKPREETRQQERIINARKARQQIEELIKRLEREGK